jgi:hypothetical protein
MTKGFGYVVFELPFRLVDWGRAHVTGDKLSGAIASFEKLLDRFRPDAVVVEDAEALGSKRHPRIRSLLADLTRRATKSGIAVYAIARLAILKCFSSADTKPTKFSVAKELADTFPELQEMLPPRRKSYNSEDFRMAIFDALALAVTHVTTERTI